MERRLESIPNCSNKKCGVRTEQEEKMRGTGEGNRI